MAATAGEAASRDGVTAEPQSPLYEGTADHVRIAAVDRRSGGEDDRAVVVVDIDPGYHINANPASQPYLIPTTLNVTNLQPLRVVYPHPVRFKPNFADDKLDVYEGTIRITAEFPPGALNQTRLYGTLTAQACTDEICLPPAELALPSR